MKRLFDFSLSLFLIVMLSPLIAAVALMTRIKLGSPVLFKQLRPGLHGKAFTIYKFRTMTNLKANTKTCSDDLRLTSFGTFLRRYSLDELPQLFNVLKGDMSFVGPRPLLMEYLDLYSQAQFRRHEVKPGMTGWSQINGRNAISWEKKFELDEWYVDHRSFFLDIKIVLITILKVFQGRDINQEGQATAEVFRGNHINRSED
ncbi:sugar transferase [Metabacillus idriensis]|uniref:sugar transferase n=1 Tax=Metabacillus idriensis TaxID=324768 RepID=UPI00296613E0|nr:sugar transferase [Metabacillus idriensis]